CSSLTSLKLGDKWDMTKVTDFSYMFRNCASLTDVTGTVTGLGAGVTSSSSTYTTLDLSSCPLTRESALVFLNGLASGCKYDMTITFSSTTYALLTDEDIKIATDKGWTVAKG
ncbi:MAG: DUF285 domain-containing protein, partial [Prevotellaceae bacterium]|nr:DUF285 domain-containing protein [Prevotellaceae bacterium]